MPLIKNRSGSHSKWPASSSQSKSKASTGTGQSYPNFFPFDINFNLGSKGKHHRGVFQHHSQPPPSTPNSNSPGYNGDFGPVQDNHQHHRSFSPFSSSTPATFSKESLNALPSIQGVIDAYDANPHSDYLHLSLQSDKQRRKSKKDRRDTLRLPMMDPRFQAEPVKPSSAARTDSPHDMVDTVEILGEMDRYSRGISPVHPAPLGPPCPHEDRSRASQQALFQPQIQGRRSRHVSLTIDTSLSPRSTFPSKGSSATFSRSQSQSRTQSQIRSQSRPESQAFSIPSQNGSSIIDHDESAMSGWLGDGPQGRQGGLDDVELQALNVLEQFNGHLMRDGYGYGTGSGASTDQSTHIPSVTETCLPSINNHANRTSRTNSISHADSAASVNRLSVKSGSTGFSSHSPSGRSDRSSQRLNADTNPPTDPSSFPLEQSVSSAHRKRTKSYGFSMSHNPQTARADTSDHYKRGQGSISVPSHRPPPPPPVGELPPLPTSISPLALGPPKHSSVPTRAATNHISVQESKLDHEAWIGSADGAMGDVGQGRATPVPVSTLVSEASVASAEENNRVISTSLTKGRSPINPGAPPIPPRSASRASASGEGDKSLRRKMSRRMLPQKSDSNGTTNMAGRKNSKDRGESVRVPLVLATTEHEDVVIIGRRPQSPDTDLPSPLEPVYQRPLPPLPSPPTMQVTSPQRTASIPHPKIAARILRPKRPSTAPSRSEPMSPIDPSRPTMKPTPMKLVPREEPGRLSASATRGAGSGSIPAFGSPMRPDKERKEVMSAFSFLALDEVAASQPTVAAAFQGSQNRQTRAASYGSGVATFTYPYQPKGLPGPAQAESPDGLESVYIMPPKERSKIGVDSRAERRRRRKGSQSSISSVAGSDGSRVCAGGDRKKDGSDKSEVMLETEGVEGDWSTAWEYNNVKEKKREKQLRLSLQLATRSQSPFNNEVKAFPNPLSPPPRPKNRPAPLNALLISRADPGPATGRPMPKSAGLLPPPRPRRKTVPSGPSVTHCNNASNARARAISPPTAIYIVRDSPIDADRTHADGHHSHDHTHAQSPTFRQISPKYTHRANLDPTTPKAHDGMRDFIELGSHSLSPSPCGSPKLETPGAFIFPPPEHLARAVRANVSGLGHGCEGEIDTPSESQQDRTTSASRRASHNGDQEGLSLTANKSDAYAVSGVNTGASYQQPGLGLSQREAEIERSISISGSISTWSSESERERERRMMTSLWLSAKPTKARDYTNAKPPVTNGDMDANHDSQDNPSGNGKGDFYSPNGPVYQRAVVDRSHPFYGTIGRDKNGGGERGSLGIQV
ncbi:hypothetical protein I317_01905 [Kwoniella heveanensis CBS 569]|nr:hypothetical protein I317_01905 [Kwoniella heveanensis CBS 569]